MSRTVMQAKRLLHLLHHLSLHLGLLLLETH
jgi:hypothetical protein